MERDERRNPLHGPENYAYTNGWILGRGVEAATKAAQEAKASMSVYRSIETEWDRQWKMMEIKSEARHAATLGLMVLRWRVEQEERDNCDLPWIHCFLYDEWRVERGRRTEEDVEAALKAAGLPVRRCGLNADWSVQAWHLGPSNEANRFCGDFYLLDSEEPDDEYHGVRTWEVVRRWNKEFDDREGLADRRREELGIEPDDNDFIEQLNPRAGDDADDERRVLLSLPDAILLARRELEKQRI